VVRTKSLTPKPEIEALAYTSYNEVPETVRYEELVKALHYLEQASEGNIYLDDTLLVIALDKWYQRRTRGVRDTVSLNLAGLWYALSTGQILTAKPGDGTFLHYIQEVTYIDSMSPSIELYKDGVVMGAVPALNDYNCCNVQHVLLWLRWLRDSNPHMTDYYASYVDPTYKDRWYQGYHYVTDSV
jgi:hypothetical protein